MSTGFAISVASQYTYAG